MKTNTNKGIGTMKTFRIKIAVSAPENDGSGVAWKDGGEIKGRCLHAILRRAYTRTSGGMYDNHRHDVGTMTVYHNRYRSWPILRLEELTCFT